jgi:hypothetical protein
MRDRLVNLAAFFEHVKPMGAALLNPGHVQTFSFSVERGWFRARRGLTGRNGQNFVFVDQIMGGG